MYAVVGGAGSGWGMYILLNYFRCRGAEPLGVGVK